MIFTPPATAAPPTARAFNFTPYMRISNITLAGTFLCLNRRLS